MINFEMPGDLLKLAHIERWFDLLDTSLKIPQELIGDNLL